VRRLGRALAGQIVVTVGERTAALAREQGADAHCLGADVEAFLKNIEGLAGPALHARGVHTRGDLAGRAAAKGLTVEEAVIYDQVARPLSRAAEALLQGNSPVVVPLFSPRSAGLLSATPIRAPLFVIAISLATREAWTGPGRVTVAETPIAEALCRRVTEAL
jgi:uroporphyrinogen-III synthase